jgi:hypothetical protein
MKSPADVNHLKLALRDQLCGECPEHVGDHSVEHPVHEVAVPPPAEPCESDCSLFVNLPRLARLTEEGEPPCGYTVFAKSLEDCQGQVRHTDVAQALTIIESAASESSPAEGGQAAGHEAAAGLTTADQGLFKQSESGRTEGKK